MNGRISFVGAGPGAADLITVRGAKRLAEADLVVYAGSLVDEKMLEYSPRAERFNSASMTLEQVIGVMEKAYREGKNTVRLHTGDPAMYGAVAEQYRILDGKGIPYEVIPGVSSVFAAAAALKTELTMPGLSQTAILTRDAGRTPVPENESLEKLAAHGSTVCIFLSAGNMKSLCGKLLAAGRAPSTPAAVVRRAGWPDETIVRGTLADIAERVERAGIRRQAMIVVGEVLSRGGESSRLYDPHFETGFRRPGFRGSIAIFALTRGAVLKAAEIASGMENARIFVPEKFAELVPAFRRGTFSIFRDSLAEEWGRFDGFVFVMASGIVVRLLAELLRDKKTDPAAVVCDEKGAYAVSLLSGHAGGANDLARTVAAVVNGKPVITTASDTENLTAFDVFAEKHAYQILTPETLTPLAAALVNGEEIRLQMPQDLYHQYFAENPNLLFESSRTDGVIEARTGGGICLRMRKKVFALGIGCRRGVSAGRIAEVAERALEKAGLEWGNLTFLASVEGKRGEKGLLEFAEKNGKPLRFFSSAELNAVEVPNPSRAAMKNLGVNSVSEASALLAAGNNAKLLLEKFADSDVTAAVAEGEGN